MRGRAQQRPARRGGGLAQGRDASQHQPAGDPFEPEVEAEPLLAKVQVPVGPDLETGGAGGVHEGPQLGAEHVQWDAGAERASPPVQGAQHVLLGRGQPCHALPDGLPLQGATPGAGAGAAAGAQHERGAVRQRRGGLLGEHQAGDDGGRGPSGRGRRRRGVGVGAQQVGHHAPGPSEAVLHQGAQRGGAVQAALASAGAAVAAADEEPLVEEHSRAVGEVEAEVGALPGAQERHLTGVQEGARRLPVRS